MRVQQHEQCKWWSLMVSFVLATVVSNGCAKTRHVTGERHLDKSGFLGEELYSKMTPGDESQLEGALRWHDDSAITKDLTKMILDPVVAYR
jgi:hypothetical protein